MKAIQLVFEMMVKYQQVKYKLKCDYEELRAHNGIRIWVVFARI